MATILSAEYGDERSTTNVLSTLQSIYKKVGKLDVPVDSSLVPIIVKSEDAVVLSDQEVKDAKEKAIAACGGGADSMCIEKKSQEFQYSQMSEKRLEQNSGANILKGRRLRVRYSDENGKIYNAEVPEGQHFTFGGKPKDDGTFKVQESISLSSILWEVIKIVTIILTTFVYAFSVLITYRSFNEEGYGWQKWVATTISVIVPYSGFLIVLGFFAIRAWIQNMPVKQ